MSNIRFTAQSAIRYRVVAGSIQTRAIFVQHKNLQTNICFVALFKSNLHHYLHSRTNSVFDCVFNDSANE
jgi:hypothetical protein